MEWILAALVIGIVGLAAAAASGRFGELPDVVDDRVHPVLPDGNLTGTDLRDVQFAVVPRGYSMEQVDALLDRLGAQLDGISVRSAPGGVTWPEQPGIIGSG